MGTRPVQLHQEPELTPPPQRHGQRLQAAWRQFVSIFRSEAVGNVRFLWVMTEHSFTLPATDRRAAAKWYPGDPWVDGMAIDAYNWFTCRPGIINSWTSLSEPDRAVPAVRFRHTPTRPCGLPSGAVPRILQYPAGRPSGSARRTRSSGCLPMPSSRASPTSTRRTALPRCSAPGRSSRVRVRVQPSPR